MSARLTSVVSKLCRLSVERRREPCSTLDWPEQLDMERWHHAPELISLHGTDVYAELNEAARRRLAFYEAINLFSLNVNGERTLMEGIARRLNLPESEEVSPYLNHFLEEENDHMRMFGRFCLDYAGRIYPDRTLSIPRDHEEGEVDFLFFARSLIFEEITDAHDRRMAEDDRLHPFTSGIHRLHHAEESRHLAFGRVLVADLFDRYAGHWSAATLERVREELTAFLDASWGALFSAEVYRDAGLKAPYELRRYALAHPAVQARKERITARCTSFLEEAGVLAGGAA